MWLYTAIILALREWKQKDHEYKGILKYTVSLWLAEIQKKRYIIEEIMEDIKHAWDIYK